MMLNDLFGFVRRNIKNLNTGQIKRMLVEINQIKQYLERVIKDREVA